MDLGKTSKFGRITPFQHNPIFFNEELIFKSDLVKFI